MAFIGSASTANVTPRRRTVALAIAASADALQLGLVPILGEGYLSVPDDVLDAFVAVLLVITLGARWRLAAALAFELMPGVAVFPTWTAFVLTFRSEAALPAALHPSPDG